MHMMMPFQISTYLKAYIRIRKNYLALYEDGSTFGMQRKGGIDTLLFFKWIDTNLNGSSFGLIFLLFAPKHAPSVLFLYLCNYDGITLQSTKLF